MPIDPAAPRATTVDGRVAERLAELERRLNALERGSPTVQAGAGPPTTAPRDATFYVDTTTHRLYVRSAGAWRYASTTP